MESFLKGGYIGGFLAIPVMVLCGIKGDWLDFAIKCTIVWGLGALIYKEKDEN